MNTSIKGKESEEEGIPAGGGKILQRGEKGKGTVLLGRYLRTQTLQPALMESLASQAKSAYVRASIKTTTKPLTCAQGPAF